MKKFIIVAGNIGVGKSTLVRMLCSRLNWQPFFEPVGENPYLADFYSNMETWSFHSQVFFLANRLKTHQRLVDHPTSVIQDRSIYEDAEVFAHNLFATGMMSERDYATYRELYQVVARFLPPPDLVLYLRASVQTIRARISLRGRDYERKIEPSYLNQLNRLYESWINNFVLCPVLTIPSDDLDFVVHPEHFDLIVEKVNEKLTGKEEVVFHAKEINGDV